MYKRKSSAELKGLAKEQLLGNYGVIVGSFAIMFAILYAVFMVVYVVMCVGMFSTFMISSETAMTTSLIVSMIIYFLIFLIISAIFYVLEISLFYMALQLSRHEPISMKDMLYCFKHHPDRVIIIYFLQFLLGLAVMIPATVFEFLYMFGSDSPMENTYFLIYCVLYVIGIVASTIISLIYGLSYFFYVDNPNQSAIECMRQSRIAMQGNKGRLFYIQISFIGWWLLSIITCGIAFLWLVPYLLTVTANFYQDVLAERIQKTPS
ncbi:MAG TPA: DUF975 family protein [Lachnospiraceae bacterium]|nr:DUF975 family protein [Lachnospiraceae bacterium]